jgi:DNA helicase-2/ATP-dependent DNA helicase PcrA
MDAEVLKKEKEHLELVVGKVAHEKKSIEDKLAVIGKDNLEKLLDVRQNETGADFEYFIQQLGEKNDLNLKDKYTRLKELEFLTQEPFFARIDLKETNKEKEKETPTPYYIGKFGYSEKQPIIIDWRAKVASVYYRYRYPQKAIAYDTPKGKEIRDLTLKRSFEIEDGKLFKYYNNDIQLDESEIIISKIAKRTGGVLEDIVSTIQISQINIIEADPRQICIVQGCVGSGKSTVAIHKLAHIFFNYPNLIHPQRSILVAKNQILSGYLSTLFPKLGIFDISYKTIRELVFNAYIREEIGLDMKLDDEQDTKEYDTKKIGQLQKKIEKIHTSFENKINDVFSRSEYISFKGLKYSRNSTPYENLTDILIDLEEELLTEKSYLKDNPNSQRSPLFKENIKALRRLIDKVTALKHEVKDKVLVKTAKEFGVDTKDGVSYKEALVFLYLYVELIGLTKLMKYEYCVVDEGQDFSLLEYLVLSKLVLRSRFSIFGDLNQLIESDGITKWEHIQKVITEAKKASVFELDTNYRSTKEIIKFAVGIMKPYTKRYLPKSINRMGNEPIIKTFDSENKLLSDFELMVSHDLKKQDKSLGIICYSEKEMKVAEEIIKRVSPKQEITILSENSKIQYTPAGLYLMKVDDCKGLEFAKVYVLGLNIKKLKDTKEARLAFVAATRAMNELTILGVE